jgi:hypothetical protein
MKTVKFYAAAALAAIAMVFVSCSKDQIEGPASITDNGDAQTLGNFQKDGLVLLLETQKMHRDVYTWINAQFPDAVFADLAESDGAFMERLCEKVNNCGIANPTLDKLPGEFEDVGVQNSYNEFLRLTSGDLQAMIENARVMEEELISTVQEQQLNLCGNDDIRLIYGNLIQETATQLKALKDKMKGLVYEDDPRNDIRDQ